MLSARKPILLVASVAAVSGSALTLSLATLVHLQQISPEAVRPFFGPTLALVCIAFIAAVVLELEYAQVLRGAEFKLLTEEELSFGQFLDSLRWCPKAVTVAALTLSPIVVMLCIAGGMPSWSSPQPLTLQVARGVMLFQGLFLLLALPIVLSGYRVPGSFSIHAGSKRESASGT